MPTDRAAAPVLAQQYATFLSAGKFSPKRGKSFDLEYGGSMRMALKGRGPASAWCVNPIASIDFAEAENQGQNNHGSSPLRNGVIESMKIQRNG